MVVRATIAGGQGWSEGFEVSRVGWGCSRALLHLARPLPDEEVGGGGPPSDFPVFPAFAPSAFVTVIDFPSSAPWRNVDIDVGAQPQSLLDRAGSFRLLLEARQHAIERGRYVTLATLISDRIKTAALGI